MIKRICTFLSDERAKLIENIFLSACANYGITSCADKAAFLAQIAHESGEFTIRSENMNYSTPARLVEIWPSRFTVIGEENKLDASEYVKNPEKLANTVYANRMGNGPYESGDGYRYRGAGFLQLTGKESFEKYAKYKGMATAEVANLIRTTDEFAMDSAAWEYAVDKKLIGVTDFVAITKRINGGTIGLGERKKYYARAKEVLC